MTSAYDTGKIPPIELRHRLRIAREAAGLEQSELAELIGAGRNTVSRTESGKSEPRRLLINAWALCTGVPVSWLLTGDAPADPGGDDGGGVTVRPKGFEPLTSCSGGTVRPLHPTYDTSDQVAAA